MAVIDDEGYANLSCRRCKCNFRGKVEWCRCPGCLTHWRWPKFHYKGEAFLRAYPAAEFPGAAKGPMAVSVEPSNEPGRVRVLGTWPGPGQGVLL